MSSSGLTLYEYVKVFHSSKLDWDSVLDNTCPSKYNFEDMCGENEFRSRELCKKCWSRIVGNTKRI
jgi:hypothetical protein